MQKLNTLQNPGVKTAVALGYFDGLHLGHQEVLKKLTTVAEQKQLVPTVLTFSLPPKSFFNPEGIKELLQPIQKEGLFSQKGIKLLYSLNFSSMIEVSAQKFFEDVLLKILNAQHLFCGFNYHFGKNGVGSAESLQNLCKDAGVELTVVPKIDYNGETISATRIKNCIKLGHMEEANAMLGYKFSYTLPVVGGFKIGRTLSFPTINQHFLKSLIVPRFGVYASKVKLNEKYFHSVTNVGVRPTFKTQSEPILETFIIDYCGEELYDKMVTVELHKFLRDEYRFNSTDELKIQVQKDVESVQNLEF